MKKQRQMSVNGRRALFADDTSNKLKALQEIEDISIRCTVDSGLKKPVHISIDSTADGGCVQMTPGSRFSQSEMSLIKTIMDDIATELDTAGYTSDAEKQGSSTNRILVGAKGTGTIT